MNFFKFIKYPYSWDGLLYFLNLQRNFIIKHLYTLSKNNLFVFCNPDESSFDA